MFACLLFYALVLFNFELRFNKFGSLHMHPALTPHIDGTPWETVQKSGYSICEITHWFSFESLKKILFSFTMSSFLILVQMALKVQLTQSLSIIEWNSLNTCHIKNNFIFRVPDMFQPKASSGLSNRTCETEYVMYCLFSLFSVLYSVSVCSSFCLSVLYKCSRLYFSPPILEQEGWQSRSL